MIFSRFLGRASRDLELVRKHLDKGFYLSANPDVERAGIDPAHHYFHMGWKEGRDPSPHFHTNYYLNNNPDVAELGICPFVHYLKVGQEEGRHSTVCDQLGRLRRKQTAKYVRDVLLYLDAFGEQTRDFDAEAFDRLVLPMFSPDYYRNAKGLSERLTHADLLKQYLLADFPNGLPPGPLFEPSYYARQAHAMGLPPVSAESSPFRHWLIHGIKHRVVPTPLYSDDEYLELNPDLETYPGWLFEHFVRHGIVEGRRFCKLFTIAPNTIAGKFSGSSSRSWELLNTLGAPDRSVTAASTLRSMKAFLESDLAHDLVRKAAEIEPWIGSLDEYDLSLVPPWHDIGYCEYKVVCDLLPHQNYNNVILMPFCKLGGADYVAGVLSRTVARFDEGRTLVLRTDQSDWARPDWFPETADTVDLSQHLDALPQDRAIRVLYELVRYAGACNIFNVNSRRGFELFERFGKQLACFASLHAYYFCADRTSEGVEVGYPIWFFSNVIEVLTTALIDNEDLARTLRARYALPKSIAAKVQTVYTPAMMPAASECMARRQLETAERRKRPIVLWAGRLDRQKRFDLVLKIAEAMPDVQFRCWGKAVLDTAPDLDALPHNVTMEGTFESLDELPFRNSDGWLYTSEWDGLPTILIECAALGVPIVASAVGGVPELINADTGWPVAEADDVEKYVEALTEMLRNPEERVRRAQALQELARARHSFDSYANRIDSLIER